MQYEVFGPFTVPRRMTRAGNRSLDLRTNTLNEFWAMIDEDEPDLSYSQGCYVFGIRAGRGIRPWYVGQTKRVFRKECFAAHKREIYREAYGEVARGIPILFLITRLTPNGAFYAGRGRPKEFDFLEKMLMGLALRQNSNLSNKRDTKFLRKIVVPGVLNGPRGRLLSAANDLRRALGV